MTEEQEPLSENEISEIIFNLVASHSTLSEIDSQLMGKTEQKELDKYKDKIWDAIGYYISMLPE